MGVSHGRGPHFSPCKMAVREQSRALEIGGFASCTWLRRRLAFRCGMDADLDENTIVKLPGSWTQRTCDAVVQVVGLARYALNHTHYFDMDSRFERVGLAVRVEQLEARYAQKCEVLALYQSRFGRLESEDRPRFEPEERQRVIQAAAAHGWSIKQTAKQMLLSPSTVSTWLKRLRSEGEDGLLALPIPVNKYSDYEVCAAQSLKRQFPSFGKGLISRILARAGLQASISTVGRMLKREPVELPPRREPVGACGAEDGEVDGEVDQEVDQPEKQQGPVVKATRPNELWHLDLTVLSLDPGYSVPWWPFTVPTRQPFTWHIGVVLDHFSRKVIGWGVFGKEPTSDEICCLMEQAVENAGRAPKYIVSDKGAQFFGQDGLTDYQSWCKEHGVKTRFGAVGKHGSVAVIERFFLSLKSEYLWKIVPWRDAQRFRAQLASYVTWYNEHRPHSSLRGCTPKELYEGLTPARDAPRYEPRAGSPVGSKPGRDVPLAIRGERGVRLELVVSHVEGRPQLPIVELRPAA